MTSERVTRYEKSSGELLPDYIINDTIVGVCRYVACYVKIVNLLYNIELIINGKDKFVVLPGETIEFDIEKHGIISSIVANVFNDIDNRILVEVGYSSKIV